MEKSTHALHWMELKLLYVSVGGVGEENFGQLWARKGEKGMMWVLTYVTPRY